MKISHILIILAVFVTGCSVQNDSDISFQSSLMGHAVKKGTGVAVEDGDSITLHHVLRTQEGEIIDSTHDRDQPIPVTIGFGQVGETIEQELVGMKLGEKKTISVPSSEVSHLLKGKTYTDTLVYEIELVAIR